MGIRMALCQTDSTTDDVGSNLNKIMSILSRVKADVYVFPELFLSGYLSDHGSLKDDIEYALDKIRLWCIELDISIVLGCPAYASGGVYNSLLFITPTETHRYDKIYLAKFGIYSEDRFMSGNRTVTCEFKGIRFGLSICYDLFFPEIYRDYALRGADVNICISAAAVTSRPFFERVLPARSLENVMYTVFVNNIGKYGDTSFAGGSRLVGPLGNTIGDVMEGEDIMCVYIDKDVVINARKERHHLDDLRNDIEWLTD